jgi:general secretion pathway protein A
VLAWAGWQFIVDPLIENETMMVSKERPPTALSATPSTGTKLQSKNLVKEDEKALKTANSDQSGEEAVTVERPAEDTKAGEKTVDDPNVLLELLLTETAKTDIDTAFAALLRQLETPYPLLPGMAPCERAARIGLRCYTDRGNWTMLRHLNRPVILELVDRDQRRHHVAAVHMKGQRITLDLVDRQVTLNQAAVEPFWFGGFTLLWKPPALTAAVMKEGDKGPDVLWLRGQLDRAEGIQVADDGKTGSRASSPSPLFDQNLKRRVIEFQRTNFVEADGIVGEQTLIQLDRANGGNAIPLLHTEATNGENHVVYP